ncbi:hypothetical protein [Oricola indica]|jgi:hypothetical protein|uniref:hypothetical protein n=1 Tax=Oricola indica TaxID=2872591 RepID=UPI001CBF195D|nr:hypothetical protein [Oricola indica]
MASPARFHAVRDRVLNANDQRFAEPVKLFFLTSAREPDPERENVEIEAPLRTEADAIQQPGGNRSGDWQTRSASGASRLSINRAAYSGPLPRKGDRVRAISRPGEPWFEVLFVDDRNHTRLVLHLGNL